MNMEIDLSRLGQPQVVESLDFEVILGQMLDDLRSRMPEFTALTESDPAMKILEVAAFRELLLRQRINDAARAVMLAYAGGNDLDQLAAIFGVQRLVLDPGDPAAIPPRLPVLEDDERLRRRVQMAPEGWSTAGSAGAYRFHALSASPLVKDVAVWSPAPGVVRVALLSSVGDGTADATLLEMVDAVLSADTVRPLCDTVEVVSAILVPFVLDAGLVVWPGPDEGVVRAEALSAVQLYIYEQHVFGGAVTLSGLYAALHRPGVQRVVLRAPLADVAGQLGEVPWCAALSVVVDGRYGA
ncbi:baseplate J/gp47 family protein [Chrysiogenes arsenatis]|uniref:baseplate J/gp47 family protein n=1 Tax=Chrysiogenes arsenatis TaxID=309797 RepID=UPI0003FDEC75|nr:baseplate J/gp47 family protein [Chrysiogenes arsenatis]